MAIVHTLLARVPEHIDETFAGGLHAPVVKVPGVRTLHRKRNGPEIAERNVPIQREGGGNDQEVLQSCVIGAVGIQECFKGEFNGFQASGRLPQAFRLLEGFFPKASNASRSILLIFLKSF